MKNNVIKVDKFSTRKMLNKLQGLHKSPEVRYKEAMDKAQKLINDEAYLQSIIARIQLMGGFK